MSALTDTNEKLLSLDDSGVHVISSEISEKLEKKKISPSMITALEGCAAGWVVNSFVLDQIVPQQPDNPAIRGNVFHKVMENFFYYPQEERTTSLIKKIVKEVLLMEEYSAVKESEDGIAWLKAAINGYYNMGGNPKSVKIAEIPNRGKLEPGLEYFVIGKFPGAERKVLGLIDQLIVDPTRDDGSVVIQDWKSGASAKQWKPTTKSDMGLAEQRQQFIYAEILKSMGIKVSGARLIYPVAQEIVNVDLSSEVLRDRVYKDIEETDKKLTHYIETNTFEFKQNNFLCAWCPLAKGHRHASFGSNAKALAAYNSQPGIEDLAKVIEFI